MNVFLIEGPVTQLPRALLARLDYYGYHVHGSDLAFHVDALEKYPPRSFEWFYAWVQTWWSELDAYVADAPDSTTVFVRYGPFLFPNVYLQSDAEREGMRQDYVAKQIRTPAVELPDGKRAELEADARARFPPISRVVALEMIDRLNMQMRMQRPGLAFYTAVVLPDMLALSKLTARARVSQVAGDIPFDPASWPQFVEGTPRLKAVYDAYASLKDPFFCVVVAADSFAKLSSCCSCTAFGASVLVIRASDAAFEVPRDESTGDLERDIAAALAEPLVAFMRGVISRENPVRQTYLPLRGSELVISAMTNFSAPALRYYQTMRLGNNQCPRSVVPIIAWIEGVHGVGKTTVLRALSVMGDGKIMEESYIETAPVGRGTYAVERTGAYDRIKHAAWVTRFGRFYEDRASTFGMNDEQVAWSDRGPLTNVMYMEPARKCAYEDMSSLRRLHQGIEKRIAHHLQFAQAMSLVLVPQHFEPGWADYRDAASVLQPPSSMDAEERDKREALAGGLDWWLECSERYRRFAWGLDVDDADTCKMWVCVDDMPEFLYALIQITPFARDPMGRFVAIPEAVMRILTSRKDGYDPDADVPVYAMCPNMELARGVVMTAPGRHLVTQICVHPTASPERIAAFVTEWVTGAMPARYEEHTARVLEEERLRLEDFQARSSIALAALTKPTGDKFVTMLAEKRISGVVVDAASSEMPRYSEVADDPAADPERVEKLARAQADVQKAKRAEQIFRCHQLRPRRGVPLQFVLARDVRIEFQKMILAEQQELDE